jgi:Outer membrane protein beta-barrel domain
MKMRLIALALALIAMTPAAARADATAFLGRNSAGDDGSTTRGFAFCASLLVLGFEFEYANSGEDQTTATPSLRTTAGNVSAQTFGLPGFQLYATTGAGYYRERLGSDEETGFLLNNGGGIKINIAGPLRVRIDYRIFTLKGDPRHTNVQRIYGGVNLAF